MFALPNFYYTIIIIIAYSYLIDLAIFRFTSQYFYLLFLFLESVESESF